MKQHQHACLASKTYLSRDPRPCHDPNVQLGHDIPLLLFVYGTEVLQGVAWCSCIDFLVFIQDPMS